MEIGSSIKNELTHLLFSSIWEPSWKLTYANINYRLVEARVWVPLNLSIDVVRWK